MRRPTTSTLLAASLLLALGASSASAQCAVDGFEPNDDCASAPVLAPGVYAGLTCQGTVSPGDADPDHYRVTLGVGQQIDARIRYAHQASRALDLLLLDSASPTCGAQGGFLDRSATGSDEERIVWTNGGTSPLTVIVAVVPSVAAGGATSCVSYELDVAVGPDPCAQTPAPDDAFEPNDTCAAAFALPAGGAWTDRYVSNTDPDHYHVTVGPNEIVSFSTTDDAQTPLLLLDLYADSLCQTLVDSSGTANANSVVWVNRNAAPVDVSLRVTTQLGVLCGLYDLEVVVTPDPCLAPQDDVFAPNGTCATGALLAPGTHTGLLVDYPVADYFRVSVPADQVLTVDLEAISGVNGDLGLRLYEDSSCQALIDQSSWETPQSVTTGLSPSATRDYYVNVYALGFPTDCNEYALQVTLTPDPCASMMDDLLEDNDACTSPTVLAPGIHTSLFASVGDEDYYRMTVAPNERVYAQISQPDGSGARLGVSLRDAQTCQTLLDSGGSSDGADTEWSNFGATPVDVVLCVEVVGTERGGCNPYDLFVDIALDPCLTAPDDAFEPNDDCATATNVQDGTYPGLFVSKTSADYYVVNLAFGDEFESHVNWQTTGANVRTRLYAEFPQNGTCGDGSASVAQGFGGGGTSTLIWTNDQPSGTFFLEVSVTSFSGEDCTEYDLTLMDDGVPTATPFCFGDGSADAGQGPTACPCANESAVNAEEGCQNSLGHGAKLLAFGSASVALDDLVLRIEQARPNQPSLLVQGAAAIAVPFKDGVLCMGNPTERVEIVVLDASGVGETASSIVTEGFVSPGDTRYYQQWYRDPQVSPCGSGSNFSSALRVDWVQ